MNEKGFVTIVPMLWGVGFLAIGFTLLPLVGLMWFLIIMGAGMLVGIYIATRPLKSGREEKENKPHQGIDK